MNGHLRDGSVLFSRRLLLMSAQVRIGLIGLVLTALWLAVYWAVLLP